MVISNRLCGTLLPLPYLKMKPHAAACYDFVVFVIELFADDEMFGVISFEPHYDP